MVIDDKVKAEPDPKEKDYHFDDAACSAEFSNEGCKKPTEKAAEEK